jgi:hypothetical protein
MALVHRLDHYNYVNAYINAHPAKTSQMRSVATGGSQTTGFLPDLIQSNIVKARRYLNDFGASITALRAEGSDPDGVTRLQSDFDQFDASLQKFEDHTNVLLKKCIEIEEEDNIKLGEASMKA